MPATEMVLVKEIIDPYTSSRRFSLGGTMPYDHHDHHQYPPPPLHPHHHHATGYYMPVATKHPRTQIVERWLHQGGAPPMRYYHPNGAYSVGEDYGVAAAAPAGMRYAKRTLMMKPQQSVDHQMRTPAYSQLPSQARPLGQRNKKLRRSRTVTEKDPAPYDAQFRADNFCHGSFPRPPNNDRGEVTTSARMSGGQRGGLGYLNAGSVPLGPGNFRHESDDTIASRPDVVDQSSAELNKNLSPDKAVGRPAEYGNSMDDQNNDDQPI